MSGIRVHNHDGGDIVTYQLALLVGEVAPVTSSGTLITENRDKQYRQTWPVVQGRFKILVPLTVGNNHIMLRYG